MIVCGQKPSLVFVSDTQQPLIFEHITRKLDHNQKATENIFNDIITQKSDAVFLLGDAVSLGYKNSKWKTIDHYLKTFSDQKIPFYATLGNHELLMNAVKGQNNFKSRFTEFSPKGYSEVIDSIAVILLNSNFNKMTGDEISAQNSWYANKIKELDKDAAIKFIVVGCHHSPYTNSKVAKPSLQVQQNFVPPFIKSQKGILFLSGHSHNFEQFKVDGKCFLVIGGGGGPHQPLITKNPPMIDLAANYKPWFHYLQITRYNNSLKIISRQLNKDRSGLIDGLELNL